MSANSNEDYELYKSLSEQADTSQAPVYDRGLFKYSLVYNKKPLKEFTDWMFYKDRIKHRSQQVNQLVAKKKTFHEFVVLGTNDQTKEIEVKFCFIFPRLHEKEQHIFLSDDFSRILEVIRDEAFLYRVISENSTTARVEYEGRVSHLPFGIVDRCVLQLLYMFSPDFEYHLDVDPVEGSWVIRKSL